MYYSRETMPRDVFWIFYMDRPLIMIGYTNFFYFSCFMIELTFKSNWLIIDYSAYRCIKINREGAQTLYVNYIHIWILINYG